MRQLVASYNYNDVGKNTQEGSDKSSKIELDLMHQWRSLFLHTEDALVCESNQLVSYFLHLRPLFILSIWL